MAMYNQPDPDWLTFGDDMYFAECSEYCTECYPEYEEEVGEDVEEDEEV